MFYDEKLCDGCSEIMRESDDIVVCPECGTPQHRECYNKNNKCVNEHLHTEGFDWQTANAEPELETVTEPQKPESNSRVKVEILSAEEQAEMAGNLPDVGIPGLTVASVLMDTQGLKPDDEFDGVKVSEVLTYIQVSASRYLKKFHQNKGKKHLFSWNWAAFFFSPAWFFYRKIYNLGAFFLALTVAGALFATPFADTVNENYETYIETYETYTEAAKEFSDNETEETQAAFDKAFNDMLAQTKTLMPLIAAFFALTFIIPNTLAALVADDAYRKKMFEDISIAKQATKDERILKYSLMRRGGVSMLTGLAALLAESYLPSIIMTIVSNFI